MTEIWAVLATAVAVSGLVVLGVLWVALWWRLR